MCKWKYPSGIPPRAEKMRNNMEMRASGTCIAVVGGECAGKIISIIWAMFLDILEKDKFELRNWKILI